jgi:hypothetical protein
MSQLVLLSVGDEATAREGFDKILALHSVALMTLQGCALLGSSAEGRTVLIADPPDEVGVQHVDVVPAFAPLVESLLRAEASEAPLTGDANLLGTADAAADTAAATEAEATATPEPHGVIGHGSTGDRETEEVTALSDVAARDDVVALLARGEYVVVFLASTIAEGEVVRQLEFLNAQKVFLTLSDDAMERLELTE